MGDSWWSDLVSGVGNFYSKNKDWINPVIETGYGAFQQSQNDDYQSQYLDYLRGQEDKNYQSTVDQINAYNSQLGGGSGAGMAAAHAQNEEARLAAMAAGDASLQKTYKQILKMYKPYRKAAKELLPQKMKTYQDSLGLQASLLDIINRPDQVAKLTDNTPAYEIMVPLPDEVLLK